MNLITCKRVIRIVVCRFCIGAAFGISPLEHGSREGETPVHAQTLNLNMHYQRVELLGIAAQSGW